VAAIEKRKQRITHRNMRVRAVETIYFRFIKVGAGDI